MQRLTGDRVDGLRAAPFAPNTPQVAPLVAEMPVPAMLWHRFCCARPIKG